MAVIEHAQKITAQDVHRLDTRRCTDCGRRVHGETNICQKCLEEALRKEFPGLEPDSEVFDC